MVGPSPYPVIRTNVDGKGESYARNREANLAELERVSDAYDEARKGGGEKYVTRHRERGRLLPMERIESLLDRDSWFLEVCPLAGHRVPGEATGSSVRGGVGLVHGVPCMLTASEATIKGGAVSELSMRKSGRIAEIARDNRLVAISLIESAGADLPNQSKIFVPGGRGFRDLTRASAAKIPTICVVFGSSTAGGAYIPGMSDYTIMVRNQAQVYLAGPPLVKMATGEETDHESLGGAEMHSRVSGVSDFLAEDERDAIRLAREVVAHLALAPALASGSSTSTAGKGAVDEPLYDAEELLGVVSPDVRVPYDSREVIARLVDGSRFSEFKPLYGTTLVTGWAHIHGFPVGILANNGILFSESANKGAQFIQLCNGADVPLLFLQNVTGFMVGQKYEQEGIIKNGAKLINAVSNSRVPAVTIMTGASYGAGNYAMCGRAYEPRFLFTWPNHRIAVMGGTQLAGVLDIIQRQSAAKKGIEVDEERLAVMKQMIEGQIDSESTAFYATARLWDDGIIDPRDTRTVVGLSLAIAHNRPVEGTTTFGVFRH
jgi:acetyl-CoA carboxylase carboxyltransferase component